MSDLNTSGNKIVNYSIVDDGPIPERTRNYQFDKQILPDRSAESVFFHEGKPSEYFLALVSKQLAAVCIAMSEGMDGIERVDCISQVSEATNEVTNFRLRIVGESVIDTTVTDNVFKGSILEVLGIQVVDSFTDFK